MNAAIAEENEQLEDSTLLRRFVADRDQEAFGLLVGRYESEQTLTKTSGDPLSS